MTSAEFTQHIRFALQHLFEISILDKGPGQGLSRWLDEVSPGASSNGQRLHQLLVCTIEQMKPAEPLDANLPRHRSYLILKRRYLDGISVQKLEGEFNSSSRQFRRESHRAIEELILALWQLSPQAAQQAAHAAPHRIPPPEAGGPRNSISSFNRNVSSVNLLDVVVDAAQTLAVIISNTQTQVLADIPADLPPVTADRVALRLAIIKLLRLAIAHSAEHAVRLHGSAHGEAVILTLEGFNGITENDGVLGEAAQLFTLADASMTLEGPPSAVAGALPAIGGLASQRIAVNLSVRVRPAVLVVDDDPAMSRILQRYLALKPVKVVSCNSTDDVVKLARETQPVLILLDVLMPRRDGWEVLQELKAHPDTYHIQLAMCSIWDERELALSLGADMFFQKPIGRAELLECIERYLN
jgi:CheY-like chemotaxis protein